jgi:copper chaperone
VPDPYTSPGAQDEEFAMTATNGHVQTYTVTGMTCGHCVSSVTEEVSAIDGVTDVAVVLDGGLVTVSSTQPLDDAAVRAAVEEAGYAIA